MAFDPVEMSELREALCREIYPATEDNRKQTPMRPVDLLRKFDIAVCKVTLKALRDEDRRRVVKEVTSIA